MPFLTAFFLSAMAGVPSQRVLLLQDRTQDAFEQHVVHQTLVQDLLNDPQVDLQLPDGPAQSTVRGAELRRVGCGELAQARRDLQKGRLGDARVLGSRAAQKLWRVAHLTGEVAPWLQARSLQAAVLAAQGRREAARELLTEVLAMDGAFDDALLRRATLRQPLRRARQTLTRRSKVKLTIEATPADTALWVDGQFAGFSRAVVEVPALTPHVVLATRAGYGARVQTLTPEVSESVRLAPVPEGPRLNGAFDALVEASRLEESFPDPNNSLFVTHSPTSVWVLRYAQGGLHLATFDLLTGRRRDVTASALITDLEDARAAAHKLVPQPHAVPALERPPTT